jgi:dienelactone hydrolase
MEIMRTSRDLSLILLATLCWKGFVKAEEQPLAAVSYDEHQDIGYYLGQDRVKHEIRSAEDWQIRRTHILDNLQLVMGELPGETQRVPLDVRLGKESREGGFVLRKISFQSDPADRVTAWLLLPADAGSEKRPAILCLHQTIRDGKDEPVGLAGSKNMHYGRELAERGYVVLAPDYPSFGEHPYDFAKHPEFASGSLKAIWDNIRAIDLLVALPEVDPQRIGVIGHSLGGHNALFTAAFEPRLKVVVSSCGFTSLLKDDLPSWTGPRYMPRIASEFGNDVRRLPFDFPEIVGCIAPRPLLACAATRDDDFDVSGVRDVVAAAQPVYGLHGKADHLQAVYPDSPHDFPPESRKQAYEFLDRHLKHVPLK